MIDYLESDKYFVCHAYIKGLNQPNLPTYILQIIDKQTVEDSFVFDLFVTLLVCCEGNFIKKFLANYPSN